MDPSCNYREEKYSPPKAIFGVWLIKFWNVTILHLNYLYIVVTTNYDIVVIFLLDFGLEHDFKITMTIVAYRVEGRWKTKNTY